MLSLSILLRNNCTNEANENITNAENKEKKDFVKKVQMISINYYDE